MNLLKGSTFRLLALFFWVIFNCSLGYSFEEVKKSLKGIVAEDQVKLGEVKSNRDPLGFFFVSDNQFNNIFGDPQLLRTKMADKVVVVAIRPPRLDLFAPDMLEHTLKKQGKGNFIIHLADATNIACKNEWTKFVTRMKPERFGKKVHEGWVMVTGNHDFIFLGNTGGHHWVKRGGFKAIWAHA